MNWLKSLWHRIAEPRIQRLAFMVIYTLHTVAGLAVILGEPYTDIAGLSGFQTFIWGGFLTLGGVIGMVTVLPGWNYFERVGIASIIVGIAIYSAVLATSPTTNLPIRIAFWCFVTGWLFVFLIRVWEIRLYLIAPKQ